MARPRAVLARDVVAVGLAISTGLWSGGPIERGGYAAWLVVIALGFVVPLGVGLVSARLPVVCGLLAVTSIAIDIAVRGRRWRVKVSGEERAAELWADGMMMSGVIWAILAVLALSTCVPLAVRRSRRTRGWSWPPRKVGPSLIQPPDSHPPRPTP